MADERTEDKQEDLQTTIEGAGAETTAGADTVEVTAQDKEHEEETKPSWAKKRIDALTREKWDAKREAAERARQNDELQARLRALEDTLNARPPPQADGAPAPLTQTDVDRLAEAKASQKAAEIEFNAACNTVYNDGAKRFGDFEETLGNFKDVGGLTVAVVQAALATDDPAKALYELAKDRDLADRVVKLPPLKLAAELTKLALKQPKPKPTSTAPAPITPVRGTAAPLPKDPEKMTTPEWMAWRDAEMKAKRAAR